MGEGKTGVDGGEGKDGKIGIADQSPRCGNAAPPTKLFPTYPNDRFPGNRLELEKRFQLTVLALWSKDDVLSQVQIPRESTWELASYPVRLLRDLDL